MSTTMAREASLNTSSSSELVNARVISAEGIGETPRFFEGEQGVLGGHGLNLNDGDIDSVAHR